MAQRRMFSKEITTSDLFVEMPSSSRLLYFDLGMEADDEGFIGNARMLSRAYGASSDDLKLLATKGFIIMFPNGVTVVKDWNLNNKLRKDRIKPTIYTNEKELLSLDDKGSYQLDNQMATISQPNDNQMSAQYRLGKDRLGKDSIVYTPEKNVPTLDQIESISESEALRNIELNKKFKVYSDTYPKKTKKIEAREFFNRLSDDEIEKVIRGAQNVLKLSKTMSSEEYKYLKNQATFISDSEYLDYQVSRNDKPQAPVGSRVPEWAKEEKKKVVREW